MPADLVGDRVVGASWALHRLRQLAFATTAALLLATAAPSLTSHAARVAAGVVAHVQGRAASYPLVTGDGFRAGADHVCDDTEQCVAVRARPAAVAPGDVVFVKADWAAAYLGMIAPTVEASHVVVVHNGDIAVTDDDVRALDAADAADDDTGARATTVTAVWTQNIVRGVRHPRLCAVPIGVENRNFGSGPAWLAWHDALPRAATLRRALDAVRRRAATATSNTSGSRRTAALVVAAFSMGTNPRERSEAAAAVAGQPWASVYLDAEPSGQDLTTGAPVSPDAVLPPAVLAIATPRQAAYLAALATHPFTLSPAGNGEQCHRTWEALLAGSVPIVRVTHTAIDAIYVGLPVVLVHNWTDVTEAALVAAGARLAEALDATDAAEARPLYDPRADAVAPPGVFDFGRLLAPYWLDRVRTGVCDGLRD